MDWNHMQNLINAIIDPLIGNRDNLAEQVILPIAAIVVMGMIMWGGFKYIQGDPETGKKTLTAAVIGLVIVALSVLIVTQVINIVEGNLPAIT